MIRRFGGTGNLWDKMTTHSKFYITHTNDFFSFPLSKSLISILYIEHTDAKIEHANELQAANKLHNVIGYWKRTLLPNSSPSSQKQVTLEWQGRPQVLRALYTGS